MHNARVDIYILRIKWDKFVFSLNFYHIFSAYYVSRKLPATVSIGISSAKIFSVLDDGDDSFVDSWTAVNNLKCFNFPFTSYMRARNFRCVTIRWHI